MSKQIPVPPELEHLIEKRERETDRRQPKPVDNSKVKQSERRRISDRRRKRQRKADS